MASTRVLKVQKNLQRILMDYFLIKEGGSYSGIVSVKEVQLQSDFKSAKVYISVMGNVKAYKSMVVKVERSRHDIRNLINKRLRMKYFPYFYFYVNHIPIPLSNVEKALADISVEEASAAEKSATAENATEENALDINAVETRAVEAEEQI